MDLITLENYASKLPPWAHDLPNHLYAIVDMGSNGIRFSVSDLSPPRARLLKCVYRERAAISLFDDLSERSQTGEPLHFSSEVISEVSKTLVRFKFIAEDLGVPSEHITVFATEAMRKAENAAAMLDAISSSSGLGVHILAPEVETLFGAVGSRSGFAEVNGLFLDLGGGSVQMSYMNSHMSFYHTIAARTGESLPFGAAKLSRTLETGDEHVHTATVNDLQSSLQAAFTKLQQKFPDLRASQSGPDSEGIDIYLCGGGFRGYGSMLMHNDSIQPYPIPAIGAYTVDGALFSKTQHMREVNIKHDGKIFGMSKRRRQQFPAIATVVEALVNVVAPIRTVTFCSGGNREGALMMKLPESIREASPLPLLHQPRDSIHLDGLGSIIETIESALPVDLDLAGIPTVFSLGLGPLFASKIWQRIGEPSEANSSFELHEAITRDPSAPGLTHLARAVLGLTLSYRWGVKFSEGDKQLFDNTRRLLTRSSPDAVFWAEYIGAMAGLLAAVCPVEPQGRQHLTEKIKLHAAVKAGKKKAQLQLFVSLSHGASEALDADSLASPFKKIGKSYENTQPTKRKVEVVVKRMVS
ncbi:Ppx/GppA phosphatase [Xylariomycetidae sp. FL2044]|nr:Ppx/GppA phosphatase [Xylariomycetidae sp. FL2044]